jgi:hypothetical protein
MPLASAAQFSPGLNVPVAQNQATISFVAPVDPKTDRRRIVMTAETEASPGLSLSVVPPPEQAAPAPLAKAICTTS